MRLGFKFTTKDRPLSFLDEMSDPSRGIITEVERTVRRGFDNNFRRQGAAAPWASLAPRTQRERRLQGYPSSRPILERSGAYRRSWTVRELGWSLYRRSSTGWTLYLGSRDRRANWHELGTPSMPARPAATLISRDVATLDRLMYQWFAFMERRS